MARVRPTGQSAEIRRHGTGWDTDLHGIGYNLPHGDPRNRALLDDDGGLDMDARRDIQRLRAGYAEIVGGTSELRQAGNMLYGAARRNALSIRRKGDLARSIKRARGKSRWGRDEDYIVYSDDPAIGPIEWGYSPASGVRVPGHHVMANAARGLPANRIRGRKRVNWRTD